MAAIRQILGKLAINAPKFSFGVLLKLKAGAYEALSASLDLRYRNHVSYKCTEIQF